MLDQQDVQFFEKVEVNEEESKEHIPSALEIINRPENVEFAKLILKEYEKLKNHNFLKIKNTREFLSSLNLNIEIILQDDTYIGLYASALDDFESKRTNVLKVQDRANADYGLVENSYETLRKIWLKFSNEGSDKKRESEAEYILYVFKNELVKRKCLKERVDKVVEDVSQKINSIKKKVEIFDISHRVIGIVSGLSGGEVRSNYSKIMENIRKESRTGESIDWSEFN